MRAHLLGVRGSTPTAGAAFAEVGGSTSCVALPTPAGRWLVLDAGTGLPRLAEDLAGDPLRGSILLTHLHWDHVQGLPFLPNADRAGAEVDLWLPAQPGGGSAADTLARAMSPPHFPIRPEDLQGAWTFTGLPEGRHAIEGFSVVAAAVHHKGGVTYGFRVEGGGRSLAYLPDHSPRLAPPAQRAAAAALVEGVDVLLHGGGYLAREQAVADLYGHATVLDALDLAAAGGVGRLVLVHHSPARTDAAMAEVEALLRASTSPVPASVGREGDRIDV